MKRRGFFTMLAAAVGVPAAARMKAEPVAEFRTSVGYVIYYPPQGAPVEYYRDGWKVERQAQTFTVCTFKDGAITASKVCTEARTQ